MPKPKKRSFAQEQAAFEALQKKRAAEKAAGLKAGKSAAQIAYDRRVSLEKSAVKKKKPETTPATASATAARTRHNSIQKTPGTTGLQQLQGVLTPKKPRKKK